jgi:hypothetical protein
VNELSLGRLEQVGLRSIWADEAGDFTPWLAQPENLRLLGETLGIELEPESEEVAVGSFWADIVCRDTADGSKVIVENQIEKTNHVHLGQILTYTAGVSAQTIVWISSKFTEEHRAALDWLNEHTTEEISFFGLEVELWRIGNSPPAPKFNVVSKPNDWSKAVRQQTGAASSTRILTDDKRIQFEFWTEFKSWLEERTKLRVRAPGYHSWLSASMGRSGFKLNLIASFWNKQTNTFEMPEIRVELVLNSPQAKDQFAVLERRRDEIEKKIGTTLVFHNEEQSQRCRIYVRRDCDFRDRTKWPEAFEWLAKYLQVFSDVFRPLIREL